MSLHRVKRPPKGGDRGAPQKAVPPPSSLWGPNVSIRLLKPANLPAYASAAGLECGLPNEALRSACDAINEAFSHYVNATAMLTANSSAAVRRDWCRGVARASSELLLSLGYADPFLPKGIERPAFNAIELLKKGWPDSRKAPNDDAFLEQMKAAFGYAVPDTYAATCSRMGEPDLDECRWNLLARLGASLAAVRTLADSAEHAWDAEASPGGSGKARPRAHMMKLLVKAYTQLFGRAPTAKKDSPGHKWFGIIITSAGDRADKLCRRASKSTAESLACAAALTAIAALARDIKSPANGGGTKLDHWIRDALKTRETHVTGASW